MSITETTKYNEKYLEVSGPFSGSTETNFMVKINGSAQYLWRKKVWTSTSWGSWSTAAAIQLDTELTLADGIKIKFTRGSTGDYNDGDRWEWTAYGDLTVSDTDDAYDNMTILERQDESDLVLISKKSGKVTLVKNYDTDAPTVEEEISNIGPTDSIDYERNNKEVYIATGKNNGPRWLGYINYSTFDGPTSQPEVYSAPALDYIAGNEPPNEDVYDIGCVLQGGATTTSMGSESATSYSDGAKLIVGINVEGDRAENFLNVFNRVDKKIFKFPTGTAPVMIKLWYEKMDDDDRCTGVAVLCKPDTPDYAGKLQFWEIPSTGATVGQNANLIKTLKLKAPDSVGGGTITHFTDFVIMSSKFDLSASPSWSLWCTTTKDQRSDYKTADAHNYQWVWKNTDFNTKADGADVDGWINVTPKMNFSDSDWDWANGDEGAGQWFWIAEHTGATYAHDKVAIHADASGRGGLKQYVYDSPKYHQLEAGGYDKDGLNPTIMWTCRLRPITEKKNEALYSLRGKAMTSAEVTSQGSLWFSSLIGPFINDDKEPKSQRTFRAASWVTYAIPSDRTGIEQTPILLHMDDWDHGTTPEARFLKSHQLELPDWMLSYQGTGRRVNLKCCPSVQPNFGLYGRFHIYGDRYTGFNGIRTGMTYVRPGNHTFYAIKASLDANDTKHHWVEPDRPYLFPSAAPAVVYTNWSDGDAAWGTTDPTERKWRILPYNASHGADDKMRWRLAEGDRAYGLELASGPPVVNASFPRYISIYKDVAYLMGVPFGSSLTKSLVKSQMNLETGDAGIGDALTSEFSASAAFFTMSAPAFDSGVKWVGAANVKKVFYRISFVYDGYQETPLLSEIVTKDDSSVFDEGVKFDIRVDDTFPISKRVKSFAVYRAYATDQAATAPESHYRFLEEVDLLTFNHDEANNWWEYTVNDSGDVEGSYEAINGINETLHSMNVNYTCNAQQNGFHFIGNLRHNQFPDAENYIFRSQAGKFSLFDWSVDFVQLPFIPLALKGFMGKLYAFGTSQVAIVNPESLFIEDVIDGVGCIGPKMVMVSEAGMFWGDHRNLYMASPSFRTVGDNIIDLATNGWSQLTESIKNDAVLAYDAKRKSFLIFFTNGSSENRCWAYTAPDQRWDLWEAPSVVKDSAQARDGSTILLLSNNKICRYLGGTNRRDWSWESKKINFNQDMIDKKIRNLKVEGSSRSLVTLKYKVDGQSAWQSGTDVSANFTGSTNSALKLAVADKGKQHWIKMQVAGENDTSGSNVKAYALSAIYKPKRPK